MFMRWLGRCVLYSEFSVESLILSSFRILPVGVAASGSVWRLWKGLHLLSWILSSPWLYFCKIWVYLSTKGDSSLVLIRWIFERRGILGSVFRLDRMCECNCEFIFSFEESNGEIGLSLILFIDILLWIGSLIFLWVAFLWMFFLIIRNVALKNMII